MLSCIYGSQLKEIPLTRHLPTSAACAVAMKFGTLVMLIDQTLINDDVSRREVG